MNARARVLVASLRRILGMYPGATAIVEIHMATEEDALLLGGALALGAPERVRARGQDGAWVRRVRMESIEGNTGIVVLGPSPEPSGDASAAVARAAPSRTARRTQPPLKLQGARSARRSRCAAELFGTRQRSAVRTYRIPAARKRSR